MSTSAATGSLILRSAGWGALIGLAAAAALTYVPPAITGEGFSEHTDVLAVLVVVLVPFGAGVGASWGALRSPRGVSRRRVAACLVALAVLVGVLWQVFAGLTGADGLFEAALALW